MGRRALLRAIGMIRGIGRLDLEIALRVAAVETSGTKNLATL